MRAKRWIIAGCAALALGVLASVALALDGTIISTSQVFQVDSSLSGVVLTNGFGIAKHTLISSDIINLARGRSMTSAVPANEVLGLVVPCGEEAPTSLIVLDKILITNLVTVAGINIQEAFEYTVSFLAGTKANGRLQADAVLAADFGATGNATNGWTSGILAFPVHVTFNNSGPCAVKNIISKIAVGNLKGIQAEAPFAIVVTKGKIITNGQSWTLIEGSPSD